MELEQKLADILFGENPLARLEAESGEAFLKTSRKQFGLFHTLIIKRVEERLSQQFGACMALLQERQSLDPILFAREFIKSPEYRQVREDLTAQTDLSPCRFEMAFLQFVLRAHEKSPTFLEEFGEIYLHELAMT